MKYPAYISQILLISIPFTLCFSHRLNSFVIILYVIAVLCQGQLLQRGSKAFRQIWIYPFVALYLLHLISLGWTDNLDQGLFILEKKAALLVLPLIIAMDRYLHPRLLSHVLAGFVFACMLALWYCLIYASGQFLSTSNPNVFFYHALGYPLAKFNAIYFSFYLFLALVAFDYLIREVRHPLFKNGSLRWFILASFCLGMILLASRLFIFLTLGYFLVRIFLSFSSLQNISRLILPWFFGLLILVAGFSLLGFTQNRFRELLNSRFAVLHQEQFRWDTPFNGLTLRMLFLKFGWEILLENKAFFQGVGVGDAQDTMNATMIRHNLYHGNPELGDQGYLHYNFHNQFMELWVQTGLPGLLFWIIILFQPATIMARQENQAYLILTLILTIICFSMIESLLERQRGVVLVTFAFSLFYRAKANRP